MSAPDISVVIGVFNAERYLRASLDSVLAQQGVALEVIAVDDGSTDATAAILRDYATRDGRLRVITQPNAGLTRALIVGCEAARGRYIARQDADDLSMPGRLLAQKEMLDADDTLAFVSCWSEVMGPEDEPLLLYRRPAGADAATRQLTVDRIGPPGHGSVMMRRDAYMKVGGYREKFYYAQDSDLWLRLAQVGTLDYVQRVLYRYRLAADSISGRLHARKLPYARLIDELHAARQRGEDDAALLAAAVLPGPGAGNAGEAKPSSGMTHYFIGRCLMARRDPRARKYLRASMQQDRSNPRAWLMYVIAMVAAPFWKPQGLGLS